MLKSNIKTKNQNCGLKPISFGFLFLIIALILPNIAFLDNSNSTNNSQPASSTDASLGLDCSSREECEALLKQYEDQINKYNEDITKTSQQKKTLNNQISLLKKKIDQLNLEINQGNLVISDLKIQINDTQTSIDKTSEKIDNSKAKLTNILRIVYEEDQKSTTEILLTEEKLSDFFDNLVALESLNTETKNILNDIEGLKTTLEGQKQALNDDENKMEETVIVQQLQKTENEGNKKTQESYLKLTEAEYQKSLKSKQDAEKIATQIRARIFELIGVPEAPTFGEAYDIAKYVSQITGVRPALLLAILTQESNIGKNVGQCFVKDYTTGAGVQVYTGKVIKKVMRPNSDIPYFLQITKALNRKPEETPVSCPMSIGWGGAMGPAQFIPETWANPNYGYGIKVEQITGKSSDPWNIKDAFLAAGLYLKDLGAATNEFNAVMKYFSGSSWSKWEEFYGRSVLSIAKGYEDDIARIQ